MLQLPVQNHPPFIFCFKIVSPQLPSLMLLFLLSIFINFFIFCPLLDSQAFSRRASVFSAGSSFYISQNPAKYTDAEKHCRSKQMQLAEFNRTDVFQVFAQEGTVMWIKSYGNLGVNSLSTDKRPGLKFVKYPKAPNIITCFPTLEDMNVKRTFLCQEIYTPK